MAGSVFEEIASSLTIKAMCSELGPKIPKTCDIEEAVELILEEGLDPLCTPSRLVDINGNTVGMIWYEELNEEATSLVSVAENLEPADFLTSSTTVFEALEFFGTREESYFYILEKNDLIGILYYEDLFKPIGRLAFLVVPA